MPRRYRRGAAPVLTAVLVVPLVGMALAAWHVAADAERRADGQRDQGRVWALWMQAAHRVTMVTDLTARLAASPGGFVLTTAEVSRQAPPGLPVPPGLAMGVIPDQADIPMAFAVLPGAAAAHRLGALDAGLAQVAEIDGPGTLMDAHVPAIATALGRPLEAGTLYATADYGLAYEETAVYRRRQPGRPWLNRLHTDLDLDGFDITNAAAVAGSSASAGAADARSGQVAAAAAVRTASPRTLRALTLSTPRLTLNRRLNAATAAVSGDIAPRAVTATGQITADSLTARGLVDAGLMVPTGRLTAGARTEADTVLAIGIVAGDTIDAGTASAAAQLRAGAMTTSSLSANSIAAGPAFGPAAAFSGAVTVSGNCNGC